MKCEEKKKRLPRGILKKCNHQDTIVEIFMDVLAFLINVS